MDFYIINIMNFCLLTHHRTYGSPYTHSDEKRAHLSPRSTSHTHHHHHQPPPASTNLPSTPPQQISSSGTTGTGRRDTPTTVTSSAAKVPLTRRKWLESSIPGLIFGGGGEEGRGEHAGSASDGGKQHAISGDNHEGQSSSMRSQSAIPSSRCKMSDVIVQYF